MKMFCKMEAKYTLKSLRSECMRLPAWMQWSTCPLMLPEWYTTSDRSGQASHFYCHLIDLQVWRHACGAGMFTVWWYCFVHPSDSLLPRFITDVHGYWQTQSAILFTLIFLSRVLWGWIVSHHAPGEIRRIQRKLDEHTQKGPLG